MSSPRAGVKLKIVFKFNININKYGVCWKFTSGSSHRVFKSGKWQMHFCVFLCFPLTRFLVQDGQPQVWHKVLQALMAYWHDEDTEALKVESQSRKIAKVQAGIYGGNLERDGSEQKINWILILRNKYRLLIHLRSRVRNNTIMNSLLRFHIFELWFSPDFSWIDIFLESRSSGPQMYSG